MLLPPVTNEPTAAVVYRLYAWEDGVGGRREAFDVADWSEFFAPPAIDAAYQKNACSVCLSMEKRVV